MYNPESWLNMQQQYDLWKNRDLSNNIVIRNFISHDNNNHYEHTA